MIRTRRGLAGGDVRLRVYTPWWMRVENWIRVHVLRRKTVRAVMVEEPGESAKFDPAFERFPSRSVRPGEFPK